MLQEAQNLASSASSSISSEKDSKAKATDKKVSVNSTNKKADTSTNAKGRKSSKAVTETIPEVQIEDIPTSKQKKTVTSKVRKTKTSFGDKTSVVPSIDLDILHKDKSVKTKTRKSAVKEENLEQFNESSKKPTTVSMESITSKTAKSKSKKAESFSEADAVLITKPSKVEVTHIKSILRKKDFKENLKSYREPEPRTLSSDAKLSHSTSPPSATNITISERKVNEPDYSAPKHETASSATEATNKVLIEASKVNPSESSVVNSTVNNKNSIAAPKTPKAEPSKKENVKASEITNPTSSRQTSDTLKIDLPSSSNLPPESLSDRSLNNKEDDSIFTTVALKPSVSKNENVNPVPSIKDNLKESATLSNAIPLETETSNKDSQKDNLADLKPTSIETQPLIKASPKETSEDPKASSIEVPDVPKQIKENNEGNPTEIPVTSFATSKETKPFKNSAESLVEPKASSIEEPDFTKASQKQNKESNEGKPTEIQETSFAASNETKSVKDLNSAESSQSKKSNEENIDNSKVNLIIGGLSLALFGYVAKTMFSKNETVTENLVKSVPENPSIVAVAKAEQQKPQEIIEHPLVDQVMDTSSQPKNADKVLSQFEKTMKLSQTQTSSFDHEEKSNEAKSDANDGLTLDEEDVNDLSVCDQGTASVMDEVFIASD